MADKDPDGPSLELPSLGFGRRKRRNKAEPEVPAAAAEPTAPRTVEPAPERVPAPEPVRAHEPPPEPAAPPLFVDEAPTRVQPVPGPATTATSVDTSPVEPEAEAEPVAPGGERRADKEKREFALPSIGGMPASVITGLLVGVLTVGLTWAGFRLCEVLQGTSSCGNPGFLLLAAIMIVMVWVGKVLLMAWGVPDPGSTSFLALGLLAVLALLFLVDVLFAWWMIIVIPVLAMGTYALSHWVTTAFVEPGDR